MPSSLTFFGLTFHLYGLLLGIAMIVAAKISENRIKKSLSDTDHFWDSVVWIIICGLLGARIWHVVTDWHLYQQNIVASLYVWQGGLSILGALAGGIVGIVVAIKMTAGQIKLLQLSDSLAVGVPFGQVIGRLGNWLNQELYGLPTNLPWKMYIGPENRLSGYKDEQYYHPLFAYELIAMAMFGCLLWMLTEKTKLFQIGSGVPTLVYFAFYGWLRFFLEFLRLDKALLNQSHWGINQVIMGLVATGATIVLITKIRIRKYTV